MKAGGPTTRPTERDNSCCSQMPRLLSAPAARRTGERMTMMMRRVQAGAASAAKMIDDGGLARH